MPKPSRPPSQSDVEAGDSSLRWFVRSRTGSERYLVDLGSYNGTGRCSCKHYQTRIEPLIRHMRKPEEAIEAGVLRIQPYHEGAFDAYTCWHIFRARQALAHAFVKALLDAEAAQRLKGGWPVEKILTTRNHPNGKPIK